MLPNNSFRGLFLILSIIYPLKFWNVGRVISEVFRDTDEIFCKVKHAWIFEHKMVAELLHFVFLDCFVSTKTSKWYGYVWPAWKFLLCKSVIKPARLYQLSGRCWKCGADCNHTGVLPILCCLVGTTFVVIILNSPHEFPIWNAALVGKKRTAVPGIETGPKDARARSWI
jgi:hypothetical protein